MVWAALAVILPIHALALPQVFQDTPLRADSDTAVMLDAVQRTGGLTGAWRWFVGDWLLENGFYRPLSSLSIAMDYTLYSESAWGFRLTNWLLLIFAALGAFSLTREYARLVEYPRADWLALGVAVALSLQQAGLTYVLGRWSAWWFVGVVVVGAILLPLRLRSPQRHQPLIPPPLGSPCTTGGTNLGAVPPAHQGEPEGGGHATSGSSINTLARSDSLRWVWLFLAVGALFWGFDRLLETHYTRLITWVPSRTALLGTVFSMWGAYWLIRGASERRGGWLGLGGALYLLALGSYEQPITLIPIVGALAFWKRRQWGVWGAKAFGVVALTGLLIIALRFSLIPAEPTRYQQQQLRSSLAGPVTSYLAELIPPTTQWQYWASVGTDFEILLVDKQGWDNIVGTLLYLGVLGTFWRSRALLGGAFGWHALAFLPMAFLHFFEHYMYLPQMGKTLFDVGLIAWGGFTSPASLHTPRDIRIAGHQ